jgi:hypothetical protein
MKIMKIKTKKMNKLLVAIPFIFFTTAAFSQEEKKEEPLKHYMPMYLDMPAELNVRKGYKEIDIGYGMASFKDFNGIRTMAEFDFSPLDNLGFEIEVPFIFVHYKNNQNPNPLGGQDIIVPEEGGNVQSAMALRLGFNYTIHSFKKAKTTLTVGYFNEFESSPFVQFGKPIIEGNVYNPFFSIAKIWGERLHTILYTGPAIRQTFEDNACKTVFRFNPTASYRFGKGRKENFVALEVNQTWGKGDAGEMVLRPQIQIEFSEKWKVGFVGGIPVTTNNHLNGSGILRLVYNP